MSGRGPAPAGRELSNNAAAEALGVSLGTIKRWRRDQKTCR